MTKRSVGIVGCGWLGKALTKTLVTNNHNVVVSTQSDENVDKLSELGAHVEIFSASSATDTEEMAALKLFNQDCLVIAIPPMIRHGNGDYPDKIKRIVTLAEAGKIKQLILISSTAVYNGIVGDVDESAIIDISQNKPHIINLAEQVALSFNGESIILRLAGLVGPERHPGKFLAAGRTLSEPQAVTNLIHQADAAGLLFGLINCEPHTEIYNGCSNTHIVKIDYYKKAAKTLGLPVPQFIEKESVNGSKTIIGQKLVQYLNYEFIYDDLLKWLDEK
jgi:nucleoside-diphosphate-sugar epimerase